MRPHSCPHPSLEDAQGWPWPPSLTASCGFHCPCSWGSHLSPGSPVPKTGNGPFPTVTCAVLLQEHSRTLPSQQMSPLSILQPSPFPSPQRNLSATWSHTGQNPALEATCPLGEWQERSLTTVDMLDGERSCSGNISSPALPNPGGFLNHVLAP